MGRITAEIAPGTDHPTLDSIKQRNTHMATAKSQMVTPLVTIWTANKKFGGSVLGSGLEGGGAVFGFGH
jgi:hypothetical protein